MTSFSTIAWGTIATILFFLTLADVSNCLAQVVFSDNQSQHDAAVQIVLNLCIRLAAVTITITPRNAPNPTRLSFTVMIAAITSTIVVAACPGIDSVLVVIVPNILCACEFILALALHRISTQTTAPSSSPLTTSLMAETDQEHAFFRSCVGEGGISPIRQFLSLCGPEQPAIAIGLATLPLSALGWLLIPLLLQRLFESESRHYDEAPITRALLIIVFFLDLATFAVIRTVIISNACEELLKRLRRFLLWDILKGSSSDDDRGTAAATSAFRMAARQRWQDCEELFAFLKSTFPETVTIGLGLIFGACFMLSESLSLGGIVLATFVPFFVIWVTRFNIYVAPTLSAINSVFLTSWAMLEDIMSGGANDFTSHRDSELMRFSEVLERGRQAGNKRAWLNAMYHFGLVAGSGAVLFMVVELAKDKLQPADTARFLVYCVSMATALLSMAEQIPAWFAITGSLERLFPCSNGNNNDNGDDVERQLLPDDFVNLDPPSKDSGGIQFVERNEVVCKSSYGKVICVADSTLGARMVKCLEDGGSGADLVMHVNGKQTYSRSELDRTVAVLRLDTPGVIFSTLSFAANIWYRDPPLQNSDTLGILTRDEKFRFILDVIPDGALDTPVARLDGDEQFMHVVKTRIELARILWSPPRILIVVCLSHEVVVDEDVMKGLRELLQSGLTTVLISSRRDLFGEWVME